MKKIICFFSAIGIYSFLNLVQAQDDDRREKFEFGIKAGLNGSNVWDEEGQDFRANAKVGFAGGIYFGIPTGKFLGIQPEILLSQKGFKGHGTLFSFPYSFSRTTTYLDIPIQLQIKPAEFLTFVLGPQFSYLLSQKDVRTYGVNSIEQSQEFENENIRRTMLGFVAGADFIYEHLVVSARVGWDFQSNHGDGTSSTPRYKNRWLQLTVGFKI